MLFPINESSLRKGKVEYDEIKTSAGCVRSFVGWLPAGKGPDMGCYERKPVGLFLFVR